MWIQVGFKNFATQFDKKSIQMAKQHLNIVPDQAIIGRWSKECTFDNLRPKWCPS